MADGLVFDVFSTPLDVLNKAKKMPSTLQPIFQRDTAVAALRLAAVGGSPAALVASSKAVSDNFDVFSCGALAGMDWSNVIAAGGSVLACATSSPAAPARARSGRATSGDSSATTAVKKMLLRGCPAGQQPAAAASSMFLPFHSPDAPGGIGTSDIDLWLFGLSPDDASKKAQEIGALLQANAAKRGGSYFCVKTLHTLCAPFSSVLGAARSDSSFAVFALAASRSQQASFHSFG